MLLALAAGCGHDPSAATHDLADATTVLDDLIAEFGYCKAWLEKPVIETGLYVDRTNLSGGWSFPNPEPDEEVARRSCLWANELVAGLRFHLHEVAPRRLRFAAMGYLPDADENRVGVWLNDEPLESFVLVREQRQYELVLPVESQRAGENRLRFEFARAARPVDHGGSDMRWLSGCFGRFELVCEDPELERRVVAAAEMLPGGSRLALGGRAIEQVSGSLLRYRLRVPEGAAFTAQLGFVRRLSPSTRTARFRLTAVRDAAAPLVLLDEPVAWNEEGLLDPVSVSLEELAGHVVALELSLDVEPGQEPVVGAWGQPRIVGPAPPDLASSEATPALEAARARMRRAPVVLVLLDAFNPAFMTAYGGRAGLTPNLDRIAQEGVLFEQAFASATYTLSSVGTMLTSLPAWEHGVWNTQTPLRSGVETWPERFAAAGYRTAAIVCSLNGSSLFGFERGFETFVEVFEGPNPARVPQAEEVLPHLRGVLAGPEGDERPLFLWLHILEPHEPYDDSPAPWRGRFDPEYSGTLTGSTEVLSKLRDGILRPSARDLEHLKAEYEEGLGYVDEILGRIRTQLRDSGLLEQCVLAVFSDHGEAFTGRRPDGRVLISHGSTVYDEMARVPLLVRLPEDLAALGARGRRAGQRVSSADLLPSVADLVGVEPGASGARDSFAPLLFGAPGYGRRALTSHTYTLVEQRFLPEFALWGEGYKYICRSGGGDELYALGAGEERDLADELPVLAGWMRQVLRHELGFDPETGVLLESGPSVELTPEALEQLRALGYAR